MNLLNLTGELAALGAAFLWAASSIVYSLLGQKISPLQLNCLKGSIAIVLIIFTLLLTHQEFPEFALIPAIFLGFSGVIGIGLGDTAYFAALNQLGARRTLLVETLAPPISALIALVAFQETLKPLAWYGILLTLIGVAWVITERTPSITVSLANPTRGIIWGLLAALSQAVGGVLSRFALLESDITPLWSTLIRISAGTMTALILLLLSSRKSENHKIIWSRRLAGIITLTSFGSTYLGIFLQQTSLELIPVGIAQTLSGTSPLFVLPLAAAMGEKISLRAILGVLIAMGGISLLFQ
ncbi:EamA family transporter [Aphanothece hegewaldii CCALA 016]|uniref:EamA family transporter n=1 Tax=Aphanothece hegewaldii CCALA 016 TaxID=2107694 RepID=A0A2T1LVB2_9CHRO|nr:DMT family transporter [Aphanothece hegewaldii]PSF35655.1 EamA family transporter [Aphanothece hegewaldii CCALA 016]